ncbi:MAG: N-acetylglucosamine-6-phosphate deacetylase, partial [Microbacterium sp.]
MGIVIHSARLVGPGCPDAAETGWVRFEGRTVASSGTGALVPEAIAHGDEVIDASAIAAGATLTPGF